MKKKIVVAFFAANPLTTDRLQLDEEIRTIRQKVMVSSYRASIELYSSWATRADDIIQVLNEKKPHVVHFSGHGSESGEIILVGENQQPKAVAPEALNALFKALKDRISLVILNACYSLAPINSITDTIDHAIGMTTSISDKAATVFAASFYRAIGFGRSIQEAFEQGRIALLLEGIPEENIPRLVSKQKLSPSETYLLPAASHPSISQALLNKEKHQLKPQVLASSKDHYTSLGKLSIAVKVLGIAGGMEQGQSNNHLTYGSIVAEYDSADAPNIPPEWRKVMPKVVEVAQSKAKKKGAVFFDGPKYCLRDYRWDIVNPYTEDRQLHLLMGKSSYFDYIGSNQAVYEKLLWNGYEYISLVDKYPLADLPISLLPLSNQFSVNLNLITADNQILVQKRSARVGNYQDMNASAINASMTRGDEKAPIDETDGNPDPFLTVHREAREELGIDLMTDEISFFGLALELEYYQPLLFGEIRSGLAAEQITNIAKINARDKFEYYQLEFFPFDLDVICHKLMNNNQTWVPVSALALLYSALNKYGISQVEKSLQGFNWSRALTSRNHNATSITKIG